MKKTLIILLITALLLIPSVQLVAAAEDSAADNTSVTAVEASPVDKAFGTFTIVIMSIGILGLPAYFWLNSRKKRLLAEYEEQNSPSTDPEEDSSDEITEE